MLQTLYRWYGRRTVLFVAVVVFLLVIVGVFLSRAGEPEVAVDELPPTVTVSPAGMTSNGSSLSLIGIVKSVDQARIETERSGRIVAVNVQIGDVVTAGQIIAQQENAAEQAAVLQAEGAYEAALAAAAQGNVGVTEAENNLTVALNNLRAAENNVLNVYRDAYTDANGIVRNQLDQFYSNPNEGIVGWRVDTDLPAATFNTPRLALRTLLPEWRTASEQLSVEDDLDAAIVEAAAHTRQVITLLDNFILAFATADPAGPITQADIDSAAIGFTTARATLLTNLNQIDTTNASLKNARESVDTARRALERAQIAASGSEFSTADAQVKQALGALRAAQASLAETVLRTPISGTVNAVSVDAGDYVGGFSPVAEVANNDALEITTFVGESDLVNIAVGDTVTVDESESGVVTAIAPAVNSDTRKVEVKIGTESNVLTTGDTVTITLARDTDTETARGPLLVPITAVKFTADAGTVFTVEDGQLVPLPVEIGPVVGSYVTITTGITRETVIVVDSRGLSSGQRVEAVTTSK